MMMGEEREDEASDGGVAVEESPPELSEPPKYAVILHNDHYTTMEFVVEVLQKYFKKTPTEAEGVMLKVHNEGRGVAGIYSRDIAETKVIQVGDYARTRSFPLRCTTEKIED